MATSARSARTARCLVSALALAHLFTAGAAGAQEESGARPDYESKETPDQIQEQVSGESTDAAHMRLSLGDAIAMGLENNLNVEVARYTPRIANEDHTSAWGAYDPLASGNLGYTHDEQPNSFTIAQVPKTKVRTLDGGFGLTGLVPLLNATLGVDFAGSKFKNNSTTQGLYPQYDSRVTVTADVPLLKDLIWNPTWTAVKTTGILDESAREDFRLAVMNEVNDIETAYWELIASEEALRVAEKSLETARALLDQVNTQYEVGVVSKVDVVEAQAGVADREYRRIVADNLYRRNQDILVNQILGDKFSAGAQLEVELTDRPEEYIEYEIDLSEAVSKAFEYRPELSISRNEVERQEIQVKFTRNQELPQFDIQGSYSATGKTGKVNPDSLVFLPPGSPTPQDRGNFGDSISDWSSNDNGGDIYKIRGVVSIPLGNVRARAEARKAAFELRRAKSGLIRTRQNIILDVRDKARNLASAQEGIQSAKRGQEAAAEQLRAERIKLEHGESTPYDVLQREEDLVTAESQLIAAYRVYRISVTGLDRAQGTILMSRNISIDEVAQLR